MRDAGHWRHDADEGTAQWTPPNLDESTSPADRLKLMQGARMVGAISVPEDQVDAFSFENVTFKSRVNALVLCTSMTSKLTSYGQHGVRIREPHVVAKAIGDALVHVLNIEIQGAHGRITYGRATDGLSPLNPLFRGTEKNEREQEYRFAWWRKDEGPVAPMLLHVPSISRFCSAL